MRKGRAKHTIEGNTTNSIRPAAVNFLAIQSMVVVTSPMGDQAPPALAAITTRAAYHILSSLLWINFLNRVISTIVAVRLSMIADRMKASTPIIQRSFLLLLVRT